MGSGARIFTAFFCWSRTSPVFISKIALLPLSFKSKRQINPIRRQRRGFREVVVAFIFLKAACFKEASSCFHRATRVLRQEDEPREAMREGIFYVKRRAHTEPPQASIEVHCIVKQRIEATDLKNRKEKNRKKR